jgi:hypothetical protein
MRRIFQLTVDSRFSHALAGKLIWSTEDDFVNLPWPHLTQLKESATPPFSEGFLALLDFQFGHVHQSTATGSTHNFKLAPALTTCRQAH